MAIPPLPVAAEAARGWARRPFTPCCGRSQPRDWAGLPLSLREKARAEIASLAAMYTQVLTGEAAADEARGPLIFTGHQPELFHPGVWAKNAAAAELARLTGGTAINLIVDTDLMGPTAVSIPTGTREEPKTESVPFDAPRAEQPWEDARVLDESLFESFPLRLAAAKGSYVPNGVLAASWQDACSLGPGTRLCDRLARMRSLWERRHGLRNLEIPVSLLCESEAFRQFLFWWAGHAEPFRAIYNETVVEYRRVNGIRNASHPVPELVANEDWIETPFWVWQVGDEKRHRLFAATTEGRLRLRGYDTDLVNVEADDPAGFEDELRELARRGVHVRSRALMTTFFTRITCADLFIHGIGGAKYDEMTDALIRRLLGIEPPPILTLTATLHLPSQPAPNVTAEDLGKLEQWIRDVQENPQRHLEARDPETNSLLIERDELLRAQSAAEQRLDRFMPRAERRRRNHERYHRLREIQALLQPSVAPLIARLRDQLRELKTLFAARKILASREYSWCLFPEERLKSLIERLRRAAHDDSGQSARSV